MDSLTEADDARQAVRLAISNSLMHFAKCMSLDGCSGGSVTPRDLTIGNLSSTSGGGGGMTLHCELSIASPLFTFVRPETLLFQQTFTNRHMSETRFVLAPGEEIALHMRFHAATALNMAAKTGVNNNNNSNNRRIVRSSATLRVKEWSPRRRYTIGLVGFLADCGAGGNTPSTSLFAIDSSLVSSHNNNNNNNKNSVEASIAEQLAVAKSKQHVLVHDLPLVASSLSEQQQQQQQSRQRRTATARHHTTLLSKTVFAVNATLLKSRCVIFPVLMRRRRCDSQRFDSQRFDMLASRRPCSLMDDRAQLVNALYFSSQSRVSNTRIIEYCVH